MRGDRGRMSVMCKARWIYWGDPAMWGLNPLQRRALQLGHLTPREARVHYDLSALEAQVFWRRLARGEVTLEHG